MTYLDGIIAWHRRRAAADTRDLVELRNLAARVRSQEANRRSFADALRDAPALAVIAEVKRRSPSKGDIDVALDAASVAREYEAGRAACLSVLTDTPHFGGSAQDLQAAREATTLPVLRKDFTVGERDVLDAAVMGADAVLLIVAALRNDELRSLLATANELSLDALVEVHDETELDRALAVGARMVGVNQRDLHTFKVDPLRAERVARRIPPGVLSVAESGISGASDAARCAAARYRAVLVGEHLVRSGDRRKALLELQVALPS